MRQTRSRGRSQPKKGAGQERPRRHHQSACRNPPHGNAAGLLKAEKGSSELACAFEVEQSTSIYSGILRMKDLALSLPRHGAHCYLVAPPAREKEVLAQMARPALLAGTGFELG